MHVDFFATLLLICIIQVTDTTVVTCDGVLLNGTYYEKEVLVRGVDKPYNLAMHVSSDLLFFSHTIQAHNEVDFSIMTCELKTKHTRDIQGIPGGYAIAHDRKHDTIYLGCHSGIYKYDPDKNIITFFAARDKSIWSIYIRNHFYYIEYPSQRLYVHKKSKFIKVSAINIPINNIFISNNSEYFYSNDASLFKKNKLNGAPIILSNNINIKQIAEDSIGNVYFCASDGIYVEDKADNKLKKIAKLDNAYGMTFDGKDQVIFSNMNTVYRLTPSKYNKICIKVLAEAEKEEQKQRRSILYNVMSLT